MGNKVCKKCGRHLPNGYAGNVCEHCKAKRNETSAKVFKGIGGVIGGVVAVAGFCYKLLHKGNNNNEK